MMIHLTLRNRETGERILPALFSENYFHLMPGDSKIVELDDFGSNGYIIRIEGFNIPRLEK